MLRVVHYGSKEPCLDDLHCLNSFILIPMKTFPFHGIPSLLLVTVISFLLPSCVFFHDTVAFNALGKMPAIKTPIPRVEIDTNISVATLVGGTVKSRKPYDIRVYYMDHTFTFATMEITALTVTYADGFNDPSSVSLKVPMRFQSTVYESYNSMAGGAVVVNKSRILDAHLSDTIQRDEPFTLSIKGRFTSLVTSSIMSRSPDRWACYYTASGPMMDRSKSVLKLALNRAGPLESRLQCGFPRRALQGCFGHAL